ncbi:MAG: hypothetical protein ABH803_00510 [Candidatus Micrarchaeota archaeon]
MKKGQLSIELFFGFAMFFLVLIWLNSYLSLANTSLDAISSQKRFIAGQVAVIANDACAFDQSIELSVPCLIQKTPGFDSGYEYLNTFIEVGRLNGLTLEEGNKVLVSQDQFKRTVKNSTCVFAPVELDLKCDEFNVPGEDFARDKASKGFRTLVFTPVLFDDSDPLNVIEKKIIVSCEDCPP